MRAQVRRFARVGPGQAAVNLRQHHGKIFRATETWVATLAIENDTDALRGFTEQERIGHGQRIADRIVEAGYGFVETRKHGRWRQLDDAVLRPAVTRDERAEGQLVGVAFAESDGVGMDEAIVEMARERDDEARVKPARQEGADAFACRREESARRLLEQAPQLGGELIFARLRRRVRRQLPVEASFKTSGAVPNSLAGQHLPHAFDQRLAAGKVCIGEVFCDRAQVEARLDEARGDEVADAGPMGEAGRRLGIEERALTDRVARERQGIRGVDAGEGKRTGDGGQPTGGDGCLEFSRGCELRTIEATAVEVGLDGRLTGCPSRKQCRRQPRTLACRSVLSRSHRRPARPELRRRHWGSSRTLRSRPCRRT